MSDAPLFWDWANDREVRQNSWSSKEVELTSHLSWFKGKIESKDSRVYVLESEVGPVAQVRYDRTLCNEAEVDFSESSKWRGQGVGTEALRLTKEDARVFLGVCRLFGIVKSNNFGAPSRSFIQSDFWKNRPLRRLGTGFSTFHGTTFHGAVLQISEYRCPAPT